MKNCGITPNNNTVRIVEKTFIDLLEIQSERVDLLQN